MMSGEKIHCVEHPKDYMYLELREDNKIDLNIIEFPPDGSERYGCLVLDMKTVMDLIKQLLDGHEEMREELAKNPDA